MAQQVKVLIVGGGAAGLGVAHYLAKQRFEGKVVVLEAKNRIGGRIHTVKFGGGTEDFGNQIVELGANWIHGGIPGNPLYTKAVEAGLLPYDDPPVIRNPYVGYWYTSGGKPIRKELGVKVYEIFTKLDDEATAMSDKAAESDSLMEFLRKRFKEELLQFPERDRRHALLIFETIFTYLSFHVGDTVDKASLKEYGAYEELPGGDVKLPNGGYQALLETFLVPDGCIQLNSQITSIACNLNQDDPVKVVCEDGSEYLAEYVVVTTSLGFLKNNHKQVFLPPLPNEKQLAINRLGFGRVDKMFLSFEKPFWQVDFETIRMAWTEEEFPEKIFKDSSMAWLRFVYNFDPVLNNPNVLMSWVAGDGAELMEALDDKTIMKHLTMVLRFFTGNPLIPEPQGMIRSKWCSDDHVCGSYSYIPVGCSRNEIGHLAVSVKNSKGQPRILFAGEATHPKYFSTVHGALLSGIRAATEIMESEKNYI